MALLDLSHIRAKSRASNNFYFKISVSLQNPLNWGIEQLNSGSFMWENLEKLENWAIKSPEVSQEFSSSVPGQNCPIFLYKLVLAGHQLCYKGLWGYCGVVKINVNIT